MKTLIKLFSQTDKLLHFIVGTYLYMLTSSISLDSKWSWLIVTMVAVGKEIVDKYVLKKKFSWPDVFMTMLGAMGAYLLLANHS